ncbi:MAG: hypothetical protein BroJett003_20950 [Planctomycetota bacterium]|nr:MAG: hypothetical protein BroJett003_20950 [Planctomycetota bacterium]
MAKKKNAPLSGWNPSTTEINMLMVSYIAQRLAFVTHPQAWSGSTIREMRSVLRPARPDKGGDPTPIPPPPPRRPRLGLLKELIANLTDPRRSDLSRETATEEAPSAKRHKKARTLRQGESDARGLRPALPMSTDGDGISSRAMRSVRR